MIHIIKDLLDHARDSKNPDEYCSTGFSATTAPFSNSFNLKDILEAQAARSDSLIAEPYYFRSFLASIKLQMIAGPQRACSGRYDGPRSRVRSLCGGGSILVYGAENTVEATVL